MTDPWREVGNRVFARRYSFFDQEVGLVLGDGELLVIDTRTSHRQADELQREIRRLSGDPWVVVNTHHHYDHTFGNGRFVPAPIWGHVRCAARMRERSDADRRRVAEAMPDLAAELDEVVVTPPDRLVEDAATIEIGGRTVELRHLGRGHTDNDLVVTVPDAGVLFAGDLVEEGAPPSYGDAYPLDWAGTLGRMLDLVRGPVVPGHGAVVDVAYVEAQLAEIASLAEAARRARAEGGTIDDADALARGLVGWSEAVRREALGRAFAQLAGEL